MNQWLATNAIMVWQTVDNESTMCNKYYEMKMNARSRDLGELVWIEEALWGPSLLHRSPRGCNLRNYDLMIVWHFGNDLQRNNLNHADLRSGALWRSKICWSPSFIGKDSGVCSVKGRLWGHMSPPFCEPIQSWRDSTRSFLSLLWFLRHQSVCGKRTSLEPESSCVNWCHVSRVGSRSLQPLVFTPLEFPIGKIPTSPSGSSPPHFKGFVARRKSRQEKSSWMLGTKGPNWRPLTLVMSEPCN